MLADDNIIVLPDVPGKQCVEDCVIALRAKPFERQYFNRFASYERDQLCLVVQLAEFVVVRYLAIKNIFSVGYFFFFGYVITLKINFFRLRILKVRSFRVYIAPVQEIQRFLSFRCYYLNSDERNRLSVFNRTCRGGCLVPAR